MARWLDNIKENTSTTGTGTISLSGAVSGFRTFSAAGAVTGDQFNYRIDDASGAWEIGVGTYTSGAPGTLARAVRSSSNANAALNLSGGATVEVVAVSDDLNFLLAAAIIF